MLEARDRVGGRTVNEAIADGRESEMGGQWVGPTQDRVVALIAELGVETFPTRTEGAEPARASTGACGATAARSRKLSPLVLLDVGPARAAGSNGLSRTVDPGRPWEADGAASSTRPASATGSSGRCARHREAR